MSKPLGVQEPGLNPFVRKPEVIEFSGFGYTQFHEELKNNNFPAPDAYLGPRSPVWTENTLREWQRQKLAEPKQPPVQTPRRRRVSR
jgi:predicted DNA-binding transcriptional regulator AlpA